MVFKDYFKKIICYQPLSKRGLGYVAGAPVEHLVWKFAHNFAARYLFFDWAHFKHGDS